MEAVGGSQSVWGWVSVNVSKSVCVCEGGIDATVAAYLICSNKEPKGECHTRPSKSGLRQAITALQGNKKKHILIHISIKDMSYF